MSLVPSFPKGSRATSTSNGKTLKRSRADQKSRVGQAIDPSTPSTFEPHFPVLDHPRVLSGYICVVRSQRQCKLRTMRLSPFLCAEHTNLGSTLHVYSAPIPSGPSTVHYSVPATYEIYCPSLLSIHATHPTLWCIGVLCTLHAHTTLLRAATRTRLCPAMQALPCTAHSEMDTWTRHK